GIVARPEEPVLADDRHDRGNRPLVRVRRDVALALEVVRRLFLQSDGCAQPRSREDGVGAVQEVADPPGLRFEYDDPEARETLEHAQLEERGECMLHALAGEKVEVPYRPAELVVAMMDIPLERLERGMDRERHVEVLGRGKDAVVRRGAVGNPRDSERTHERAATAVADRPLQLARPRGRV